jgi:hypothetical protein
MSDKEFREWERRTDERIAPFIEASAVVGSIVLIIVCALVLT